MASGLEEKFSKKTLDKVAKEANEKLANVTEDTDLEVLETEIIEAQQEMKFAAKYAQDNLVKKNFKTLQSIIDDEPEYQVYESANGAKSVRIAGTENKDRLTAINTFLKFNLETPGNDGKGSQHVHLHDSSKLDELMNNLLRGQSST